MNRGPARDCIAWAADLPLAPALQLYERVAEHVGVVKVGLSLFVEQGPKAVAAFLERGGTVFLDLKLHDIPNTVELATARAAELGVRYLTVHAQGGRAMVEAACRGALRGAQSGGKAAAPTILAVTVLTSMDDAGLVEIGVSAGAAAQAERLALNATVAGAGGLVCSAREVGAIRRLVGAGVCLCTPGIRPAGARADDQARVETPGKAIREGADLLVVGRPISESSDPVRAAAAIEAEVAGALS